MRTTHQRAVRALGAAALAAGLLTAGPTATAAEPTDTGAVANYEGQRINLAQDGWRDAHTCVVHTPDAVDCYRDGAEADSALGYDRATDTAALRGAAVPACANGWLCLYQHANGKGRRLIFNDERWHNLYDYGFQNETSSWRNNQGDGDSGGLRMSGNNRQIWLDAPGYVAYLGNYNDRAYMVHG
ncbi:MULTISPECIES: peptidase inhibitor family I36 protein [unclassified Streptomyces]|uniref:peptidase inhibitor family I36 protein n=1 Tax=unclassified Streptomyces TaxID=2593676 RepID=UPI0022B6B5D1|nr:MULTISPECIES: peptidase inhibitor family I36 protein [unclassified Streptomyces]MCZ7417372.1 peptidase inhibitor family I36 protein [Streptomyces sp. WMMC897]MCZ7432801.1 peptidase inhibitor family I36 protein [Streptomyces sp. WMMC1477]